MRVQRTCRSFEGRLSLVSQNADAAAERVRSSARFPTVKVLPSIRGEAEAFLPMWSSAWPPARFRPSRAGFASAQVSGVQARNGSPEDTDLERISLRGPRIKDLRDLFVIESGARSRSRTLSVLSVCEYRGGLTQQRFQPRAFWRAPAVTLIVPSPKSSLRAQRRSRSREASPAIPANG